ncbi:MAG: hypothetical protein QOG03_908 [Actinomycetota bacterium]|jgi:Tfp pilus assembly protein PilX|nr:hypothetical protein [Actinomycetota bacterium]
MLMRAMSRPRRDESGSLILAMGVMMILTFLSIAILARSVASLKNVRRTQDFSAALAAADGGMSEALFKIDQVQSTDFSGTGTLTTGSTFSYTAHKVDTNTWTVTAKGTVNGVAHAVQSTVKRSVRYPYAIFAEQDLRLNGNGNFNVQSYNSTSGATNTGNAIVASNHGITLNGGGAGSGGDAQVYYTPNGSCTGCWNGKQVVGPYHPTAVSVPTSFQACPTGGAFSGTINGQAGLAFKCTAPGVTSVSFSGTISVTNGPVVIYIGSGVSVSMADATINRGAGTHGKDFIIEKVGADVFDVGNGSHAVNMNGVLDAPQVDLTVDGGQMTIDGSITVNSFRVNGNPNFTMNYDDSIATITTSSWSVSDWQEIPSSQAG